MNSSQGEGRATSRETSSVPKKSRVLTAIAVALAAIALAVAFVVPRLPAPAILMAQHSVGGPLSIGPSCTYYAGAEVTIAVPGPGTIVVSATVGVGIGHDFGQVDEARIVVTDRSFDCELNAYTAFVSVPATLPTDPYHFETVPVVRPFAVPAGSHTFYVNGIMAQGNDPIDRFDSASMVAVFYPS